MPSYYWGVSSCCISEGGKLFAARNEGKDLATRSNEMSDLMSSCMNLHSCVWISALLSISVRTAVQCKCKSTRFYVTMESCCRHAFGPQHSSLFQYTVHKQEAANHIYHISVLIEVDDSVSTILHHPPLAFICQPVYDRPQILT